MRRTDCPPFAVPDAGADPVRQEAARWFARARSGEWDGAAQAALDAWLAENPRHAAEYRMLESIWQAAATMPEDRLRALADPPRRDSRPAIRRALASGLCVLAIGTGTWLWQSGSDGAEYRSALGERRSITLPDGSTAELNGQTRLQVQFDGSERRVVLREGEALFAVEKYPDRPFVVDAGLARAKVTGTRFDVRRDPDQVQVVVESGSVEVAGVHDQKPIPVTTGNAVRVDGGGRAGPARSVPVAAMLAWREGQIVFSDTGLASAVREVSRYRQQPIVLAPGQGLENLRLTSVFRTSDTDSFIRALPQILPVEVRQLADGRAEIIAR
jgi:transmembrane sensor